MQKNSDNPVKRSNYRHGDLRRALLEAGIELARGGGPEAVVLREATRRAGVVPNAAYRHFSDKNALLEAVCEKSHSELAMAIENEIAALPVDNDPAAYAKAILRAVGTGYLTFARTEPGLFKTAFSVPDDLQTATSPAKAGKSGMTPFQLLSASLDKLTESGALPQERRAGAEFVAWSAVHGLAMLILDGPLRYLDESQQQAISQRLLEMVEKGL